MTTHSIHARHIHEPAMAAATTPVHDEPHTTDPAPHVFALTPAQEQLLKSLHFRSDYEIAHAVKASPDVGDAFDATAIAAIEKNAELGGATRAGQIKALLDEHNKLADLVAVLTPLCRLAAQNLLAIDSQLAQHVGEPLRVAHSLSRSQPQLLEQLQATARWSSAHHGHRHAASPAPAATARS